MSGNEKDSTLEILKTILESMNVSSVIIRLKPKTSDEPKQADK